MDHVVVMAHRTLRDGVGCTTSGSSTENDGGGGDGRANDDTSGNTSNNTEILFTIHRLVDAATESKKK